MYQNNVRMGMLVKSAMNTVVNSPPPTFRASNQGTPRIKTIRRVLEKLSLPDASAGSGAFLIAGYWRKSQLCA